MSIERGTRLKWINSAAVLTTTVCPGTSYLKLFPMQCFSTLIPLHKAERLKYPNTKYRAALSEPPEVPMNMESDWSGPGGALQPIQFHPLP